MQKHDHVPTNPGAVSKAPEYVPDAVRPLPVEEGSHGGAQSEDINIPLVALMVGFFAVLLLITVFALQAWFYNAQHAETIAKQVDQGASGTPLGDVLSSAHTDLYSKEVTWNDRKEVKPHTQVRIPIDRAIDLTVQSYASVQGNK